MTNQEFGILFKKHIEAYEPDKLLDLAVSICKKLYFDYQTFTESHQWGDADLLMDAINLCDTTEVALIEEQVIEEMLIKIEPITPDSDDLEIGIAHTLSILVVQ